MAIQFVSSSSEYYEYSDHADIKSGAGAFAVLFRMYLESIPGVGDEVRIINKGNAAGGTPGGKRYEMVIAASNTFFAVDDNVDKTQVDWAGTPATNVWQDFILSRDGTNLVLYEAGVSRTSTSDITGDIDSSVTLVIGAGRISGDTIMEFADVRIADFAYLNRAITTGEIAAFSKGYSSEFFNPSEHIPFIRETNQKRGGSTLSATGGTPIVANHPRVIYPSAQILQFPPVAAVGGVTGKSNPLWGPLGGPLVGVLG